MKFWIDGQAFECKINKFPSGELGVVLPEKMVAGCADIDILYDWSVYGNNGIIVLAQLVEALNSLYRHPVRYHLTLPYVPYSRQDRVCNTGESFSLKVFTSLINNFKFNTVTTWDNHSDVATALINNCVNKDQYKLLINCTLGDRVQRGDYLLVSPDNGASKKTASLAGYFQQESVVRADKVRDITNGRITATTILDTEAVRKGFGFLVVDDICDGGGTFVGLGNAIRDLNEQCKLDLYVTHGFFTKGLDTLLELYDHIYTTDSVCNIEHEQLTVIKLKEKK